MPNRTGENITSFTGEQTGDAARAINQRRGELALSAMSVDDILRLDRNELEKFSLAEIMEAKARLEAEYRNRYGVAYQSQSEQPQPEQQPEQTPDQPTSQPAPTESQSETDSAQSQESEQTLSQDTESGQSATATEVDETQAASIVDEAIATAATATAGVTAADIAAPNVTEAEVSPTSENDQASTQPTAPDAAPEAATTNPETITVEEARAIREKAKRKPSLKRLLIGKIMPIALGAAILFGAGAKANVPAKKNTGNAVRNEQQLKYERMSKIGQSAESIIAASMEAADTDNEISNSEFAGELSNGVVYDYSHYADRDNKESYNAFDYDMSEYFNDVDGTKESFMKVATTTPEALAAYSYSIFNDSEKAELGISGMTANQIDDYISNNENGGAMQQRLLAALQDVLDSDDTKFNFYYENGTEKTNYIYFVDDNENGRMDPGEVHLAYDIKDRENAPQVDIIRSGKKVLDLNMLCGYQPNFKETPEGVPHVPSDEQTDEHHNKKTGSEGTKTGSEGTKTGNEGTKTASEGTDPDSAGAEGTDPDSAGSEGTDPDSAGAEGTDPDSAGSEGTDPDSAGAEGTDPDSAGSEGTDPDSAGAEGTDPDSAGSEGTDLTPKNEEAEKENAGDRVDVRDLDENVTPATTKEEDEANFEAIEKQKQEDEKKKAEDEKTAAEQAEKERQAAKEAEERREREAREKAAQEEAEKQKEREREAKAEEAKRKAEAEAERKQKEAEQREREAQKEREEREAAQEKADREEKQREKEAEEKKDDNAKERANTFEEGDY